MERKTLEYCARQAVEVCMNVKSGEKVIIIYDNAARKIAAAIANEVRERKYASLDEHCLEEYGSRPDDGKNSLKFPDKIKESLQDADVSFFVRGERKKGERKSFVRPMLDVVDSNTKLRHAHMPAITEEAFLSGMSSDYHKLSELTRKVHRRVKNARKINVTTPSGSNFTAEFGYKWVIADGIIKPIHWDNLPGSEVFTCPSNLEGKIVVDGGLGDYFDQKYGLLDETPLAIKAKKSRIVSVSCPANRSLESDFKEYISTDENANRFGEFAIGTNIGIEKLLGNMLHDEKFPGVHVAVGHPYPKETGADWDSEVHCDMVMRECNIFVEGVQIMKKGVFHRYLD